MTGSGRIIAFPERAAIEEEAARWVVRLSEAPSEADRMAFEAWRRASPHHAEVYARLNGQWTELDTLADLRGGRRYGGGVQPSMLAAAAALVLAIGVGAWIWGGRPGLGGAETPVAVRSAPPVAAGVFETAVGEQRRMTTSDGSTITLNTGTRADVRMSDAVREVRLAAGEAFFQVAHEPERPFRVETGAGVIEAIGTAFSVRVRDDEIDVVVEEGKVAFAPDPASRETTAYVLAGQSATFSRARNVIETVSVDDIEAKLAWRGGRVVFRGDPLSQVVEEIARYTGVSFEIADPDIQSLRIGGYFELGDVDGLMSSLEQGFDLQIERIDAGHIRISAKEE